MSAVLAYENIQKHYGDYKALGDVSLEVRPGEVFGLLGPNGAGKTTLIRIGLDILRPDRGTVKLFGKPLDRNALSRVAYLPEERGLYKKTGVVDMLIYLGVLKGMSRKHAKERALTWLGRLGLGDATDKTIDALSKGMTQKVQLIGALFGEPEVCILDEPFSGLDPAATALVKELISERRSHGLSTILSTHMMNQVEALCDRVAVIHAGERVVYGPIDEVRQEHSLPELFLRTEAPPPAIDGASMREEGGGYVVTLEGDLAVPDYVSAIVAQGTRVQHVEPRVATMEEIFLHVTGESLPSASASALSEGNAA